MTHQLRTLVGANVRFCLRNRLMLVLVILLGAQTVLTLVPSLIFAGYSRKFDIISQTVVNNAAGVLYIFTAAIGLLIVSHHLSSRSLKMVVTKPVSMEAWLFSVLAAALSISLVLHAALLAAALVLFGIWSIPIQWGILYILLYNFLQCIIGLSWMVLLTTLVHPVVAVILAVILRESTFLGLGMMAKTGEGAITNPVFKGLLAGIKYMLFVCYYTVPMFSPYGAKLTSVHIKLRAEAGDLKYLAGTALYALVFCAFCFVLSDYVLKRRRLI